MDAVFYWVTTVSESKRTILWFSSFKRVKFLESDVEICDKYDLCPTDCGRLTVAGSAIVVIRDDIIDIGKFDKSVVSTTSPTHIVLSEAQFFPTSSHLNRRIPETGSRFEDAKWIGICPGIAQPGLCFPE